MKITRMRKKFLSFFLCMMLIVAMALGTTGCNGSLAEEPQSNVAEEAVPESTSAGAAPESTPAGTQAETVPESTTAEAETTETVADTAADVQVMGEGNTVFTLSVVDADGMETLFKIHTDKTNVGEALLELELIAGDKSDYGLYVKTVNGITVDYDKDGKYWAFYINDEYAQTGVDQTDITEGDTYSLRVE